MASYLVDVHQDKQVIIPQIDRVTRTNARSNSSDDLLSCQVVVVPDCWLNSKLQKVRALSQTKMISASGTACPRNGIPEQHYDDTWNRQKMVGL